MNIQKDQILHGSINNYRSYGVRSALDPYENPARVKGRPLHFILERRKST
jgi:hypothetical protein